MWKLKEMNLLLNGISFQKNARPIKEVGKDFLKESLIHVHLKEIIRLKELLQFPVYISIGDILFTSDLLRDVLIKNYQISSWTLHNSYSL